MVIHKNCAWRERLGNDARLPLVVTLCLSRVFAQLGNFGQANYSASKGGVMSMTLTFARELGRSVLYS